MNHKLLKQVCGAASYQRGKNYYQAQHVLDVDVQEDLYNWFIRSQVRGSHNYRQTITISKHENTFKGLCTCPVSYNCKHVAAALLFALEHNVLNEQKTQLNSVDLWLDELSELALAPVQNSQQNTSTYSLLYILEPGVKEAFVLYVIPQKVRLLKKGGYGKATSYSLNRISHYSTRQFLTNEDQEIAQLLAEQPDYNDYYYNYRHDDTRHKLTGDLGELALQKMLFSGRCHWLDKDSQALTIGDIRKLNFQWQGIKKGKQLSYRVEPEISVMGRVARLWYIDANSDTLGPLESGVLSPEQIIKLVNAPLIPKNKLEAVSRRLLIDMPSYQLPPPLKLDINEVHIAGVKPQFQLRLHSREHQHENAQGQRYHCAQLTFNYPSETDAVCLEDFSLERHTSRSDGNTIYRVERDLDAELEAVKQMHAIGMLLDSQSGQLHGAYNPVINEKLTTLIWIPTADSTAESAANWYELLNIEFPNLQAQGWEIITDDNFALSFEEAEHWHAELEESDTDWFSLSLGIECDGEKTNLLPSMVQLLSEFESPQQLREYLQQQPYILILAAENRWIKLPSERLLSIFETLIELYDRDPLNDDGTLALSRHQGMQLDDLLNDPALRWYGADELKALNTRLRDFDGIQAVEPPQNFNATLRPYQQQGVNWLQFLNAYTFNGILADDMGLGKTVQTLAHLLLEKQSGHMQHPALIVAPTSLIGNWRREIERFASDLQTLVLYGPQRHTLFDAIQDHDIILTSYPLLYRDQSTLLQEHFHTIVLDEAQYIKNPKSQTAQVAFQLKAEHRLALTGTPMENHLGELWSIYHFLMPGFLGDLKRFNRLFRKPIEQDADEHRQQQLQKRISPFLLRRSKQDVLEELPAKIEIISTVTLQGKQRDLYETVRLAMDKKVQQEIAKKGIARSQIMILDALLKLRQTCCDPRIVSLPGAKKIKQSAKLTLLMEILPEMVEEGRKILLFSQFTKMLSLIEIELKQRGITYSKLTGQTRKRDEAIDSFQNGDNDVFLISLKAGGVGLNLTAADTVIHYDPWWNPAAEKQATDRAHRIGQKKAVFVYKLVTEGTVEEKIIAMQERKQALADAVYSGKSSKQANAITAGELSDLLGAME